MTRVSVLDRRDSRHLSSAYYSGEYNGLLIACDFEWPSTVPCRASTPTLLPATRETNNLYNTPTLRTVYKIVKLLDTMILLHILYAQSLRLSCPSAPFLTCLLFANFSFSFWANSQSVELLITIESRAMAIRVIRVLLLRNRKERKKKLANNCCTKIIKSHRLRLRLLIN